jgi:hypothetical protein
MCCSVLVYPYLKIAFREAVDAKMVHYIISVNIELASADAPTHI